MDSRNQLNPIYMHAVIGLRTRFTLAILIKKGDKEKLDKLLEPNDIKYSRWCKHPMDGFIEFRADVNIRQAEIIRQLMKNITVYD